MSKRGYKLLDIFTRYYKLTLHHNSKPSFIFKIGLFGRLKIDSKSMNSKLEKATKEEIREGVEDFENIRKTSEYRENDRI